MAHSRIISIRKFGAPLLPTIVRVKAYPSAIDELLIRELTAQYLRTLRVVRGKVHQLILNYLEGEISEEELKREYIRYVKQNKDISYVIMALTDFSYLIEDLENSINLIEKTIDYICLNKKQLSEFDKILTKNIVNKNLSKLFNYRKAINLIRTLIKERLIELQVTMNILREKLKKNKEQIAPQRLDEIAATYVQYSWAFAELLAIQLSMSLGLTSCLDELLKLMDVLVERKHLGAQLLVGEIDKREYSKRLLEIRKLMHNYRTGILGKIKRYRELKATIDENEEYLKDLLGEKSFKSLKRALNISEKCIKTINKILEKIDGSKKESTLEEY